MEEFERLGKCGAVTFDFSPFLTLKLKATIKTELAFCISTANSSALAGIRFQKSLESLDISKLSPKDFETLMRSAGVRFARRKAEYVFEALRNFDSVERALKLKSTEARRVLVKNVRGLGYKEASHFLRNLGRRDVAIIDRHVMRWLGGERVTPKNYERFERKLKKIAKEMDVDLAELDLRIWFEMTGRVLK